MDAYSHETNSVRLGYVLAFIALFLNYGVTNFGVVFAVLTFAFAYLGECFIVADRGKAIEYNRCYLASAMSCVISYLCWLVSTFA